MSTETATPVHHHHHRHGRGEGPFWHRLASASFITWLYLGALFLALLPFGRNEAWILAGAEVLILVALWLFLLRKLIRKNKFYIVPGAVPLLLLALFMFFQCLPLPQGLVQVLSPAAFAIYSETVLQSDPGAWLSLSLKRQATLHELLRMLCFSAFYVLSVQMMSKQNRYFRLLYGAVALVALYALFGILQRYIPRLDFGFGMGREGGGAYAASVLGLLLPLAATLFIVNRPSATKLMKETVSEFLSERDTNLHLLLGAGVLVMLTALFLTSSKWALLSACLSFAALGAMMFFVPSRRLGSLLVVASVAFYLLILSGWRGAADETLGGLEAGRGIVTEFLATGVGFGALPDVYPLYATQATGGMTALHTNSDYMDLAVEGGALALLFGAWFLAEVLVNVVGAILVRKERSSRYLTAGALAGIVYIMAFSGGLSGFSKGINALYLAFLLAVAVSSANTRRRDLEPRTFLPRSHRFHAKAYLVVVAVIAVASLLCNAGALLAESAYRKAGTIKSPETDSALGMRRTELLARAVMLDPMNSAYRIAAAEDLYRGKQPARAAELYASALAFGPTNAEALQGLALSDTALGRLDRAQGLFVASIKYGSQASGTYMRYIAWLFTTGQSDKVGPVISNTLRAAPELAESVLSVAAGHGMSTAELASHLPERMYPHLVLAEYCQSVADLPCSSQALARALELLEAEPALPREYYKRAYGFSLGREDFGGAEKVMKKAVEVYPSDLGFRLSYAALYAQRGITYRAAEEYGAALRIDPDNAEALAGMKKATELE